MLFMKKRRLLTFSTIIILLSLIIFLPADYSVAGAGTSSLEELEDKLDAATAQREEAERRLDSAKEDYADALEEKSLLDGKILA